MLDLTPFHLLDEAFFQQDTLTLARQLLGKTLFLRSDPWVICRIVETEAYTQDDPACHAYQRNTGRAANLYQRPGIAYVYMIYGMYYCLNVVTDPQGTAGAVLFRAAEVIEASPNWIDAKLNGPGKLCKGLGLNKASHNGLDMLDPNSPLQLREGGPVSHITETTRIGITQAKNYPWRFYDAGSSAVSKR